VVVVVVVSIAPHRSRLLHGRAGLGGEDAQDEVPDFVGVCWFQVMLTSWRREQQQTGQGMNGGRQGR
jgi:hypothetical protein